MMASTLKEAGILNRGIDELIGRASKARTAENFEEGERLAREALDLDPESAQARLLVGVIEAQTNRFEAAAVNLAKVCEIDRFSFHARMWLSRAYLQLGRRGEAIVPAEEAVRLQPASSSALIWYGLCLLELHRYEEAFSVFGRAGNKVAKSAVIHEGFGRALQGLGQVWMAAQAFQRAVQLDPTMDSADLRLGEVLLELLDFAGAEICAQRLLARNPNSARAQSLMARALMDQDRGKEALSFAERALRTEPDNAAAASVHGQVLQNLGDTQRASAEFERAIALDPMQTYPYFALAYSRKITNEDVNLIAKMESLEADRNLSSRQQAHLQYALGKAAQDLGRFESAMRHFDEANRRTYLSRFGDKPFDRDEYRKGVDFVERTFSPEFLRRHAGCGIDANLPIFVVGMMRSGTTLVEQILSSHSKVAAAGEQLFWMSHRGETFRNGGADFDEVRVKNLAREYVAHLQNIVPDKERVIDKMPENYSVLGLIHLALPHAKIVHIKRHPVDTCLSIYTTSNRSRIEWTNDKENIVFAYRQYERLMAHWVATLPADRLLTVQYEDLILDAEGTTRQMVQFCGLEWEDACLRPEQNQRSVLTPGVWPVRQPVYRTSLERWRNYEPWLGAFAELL